MAERFDVVVGGGGHNGLVAATYLARRGAPGHNAARAILSDLLRDVAASD